MPFFATHFFSTHCPHIESTVSNTVIDNTNNSPAQLGEATPAHRFCLAPMMDWSDRHCRYFWRLMTGHSLLYTEMITTGALLYGDAERQLAFDPSEHPLAVQLGGSDREALAHCALRCQQAGYDEINLNVGCPSERVKSGAFGACLMNQPQRVADAIKAMRDCVDIPVTIKCRIGVDDNDSYEALCEFVEINRAAGCERFIVHARKAWLSGLSPKQNRDVPPLDYPRVYQLKRDFPSLTFILNGGLKQLADCEQALQQLDGVMIGREAYQNPYLLQSVDEKIFQRPSERQSRQQIGLRYAEYIERELQAGTRLNHMTRHALGLFNGVSGARRYRRQISEQAHQRGAGVEVFLSALEKVND